MRWVLGLWYKRLRRIDLDILWPSCRSQAKNLDHARAAFATHAYHDRAWLALDEHEVERIISKLT